MPDNKFDYEKWKQGLRDKLNRKPAQNISIVNRLIEKVRIKRQEIK